MLKQIRECHLQIAVVYTQTPVYTVRGGWCGGGGGSAKAIISQIFSGITDCKVKAHVKCYMRQGYSEGHDFPACSIQIRIGNEWKTSWAKVCSGAPIIDTIWSEICTTIVNGTVDGIRFCASTYHYMHCTVSSDWSRSVFWIDDVYVGGVGVEEGFSVKSAELRVYPNPFMQYTEVRCQKLESRIKIYDITGRLARETESNIIGEELAPGVYFLRGKEYKPIKIIKIGGVK